MAKWYHPKKHSGWRKTDPAPVRRRKEFESTDKRKSLHDRYVEAARAKLALANVTRDRVTKMLARRDADYFFTLAKKAKK